MYFKNSEADNELLQAFGDRSVLQIFDDGVQTLKQEISSRFDGEER